MGFRVIEPNLRFARTPSTRRATNLVVAHHTVSCPDQTSVRDVHEWHLNRGWVGIGYHFLVRGDGRVKRGRPLHQQGAHARPRNHDTVGVAFAGNFQNAPPSNAQYQAGAALIYSLHQHYGRELPIWRHSAIAATACPGRNFDLGRLRNLVDQRKQGRVEPLSWEQEQSIEEIKALAKLGLLLNPEQHIETIKDGAGLGDHVWLSLLRRIAESK